MNIPGVGSNYQIIVEEVDGVEDVRVNVEAEPGIAGFMVEKALKVALGFSSRGTSTPSEGCPGRRERAQRVFHKKIWTPWWDDQLLDMRVLVGGSVEMAPPGRLSIAVIIELNPRFCTYHAFEPSET